MAAMLDRRANSDIRGTIQCTMIEPRLARHSKIFFACVLKTTCYKTMHILPLLAGGAYDKLGGSGRRINLAASLDKLDEAK